ncbi:MAG: hypothetical protein J6K58_06805 [Lachnospiraceae bacterium]|nr:hypothetical protein [Lachnospiraceae bacterium]MBP3458901.1 hypothetical protein [Lachnospiraceae bacterium]
MGKKTRKQLLLFTLIFIPFVWFLCAGKASALSDDKVMDILLQNKELFENNDMAVSFLRRAKWGLVLLLGELGSACTKLYDTCFGFVDFTSYKKIENFIEDLKPMFVSLVCLSLFFLGLILIFWHEKKPKFVMNLCIAILVISSSSYLIHALNGFIGTEVRKDILGGSNSNVTVYETIGTNIHDLLYLDAKVGLSHLNEKTEGVKNAKLTYDSFTQLDAYNLIINEVVEPDDVKKDSRDIIKQQVKSNWIGTDGLDPDYVLKENYDGVAWTSLLNNYYYRYKVDYSTIYLELLSLVIIYVFLSYKVISTLFDIVVHRILAYLYSANLSGNQKILKILDGIKDSYIILLITTILLKLYLLACKFTSDWDVSGLIKGFIILFFAFAVTNGPNIIQKLTGLDGGVSDGMGKIMTMLYGTQMTAGLFGAVGRMGHGSMEIGNGFFGKIAGRLLPFSTRNMDQNVPPSPPPKGRQDKSDDRDSDQEDISRDQRDTGEKEGKFDKNYFSSDSQDTKEGQFDKDYFTPDSQDSSPREKNAENTLQEEADSIKGQDKKPGKGRESSTMHHADAENNFGFSPDPDIGGEISDKEDALNGIDPSGREGYSDSLKTMEKDLSARRRDSYGDSSFSLGQDNSPLASNGKLVRKPMNMRELEQYLQQNPYRVPKNASDGVEKTVTGNTQQSYSQKRGTETFGDNNKTEIQSEWSKEAARDENKLKEELVKKDSLEESR